MVSSSHPSAAMPASFSLIRPHLASVRLPAHAIRSPQKGRSGVRAVQDLTSLLPRFNARIRVEEEGSREEGRKDYTLYSQGLMG